MEFLSIDTMQMIYQITLAAVLGMLVGFEREYRGKPAGLRTYMLVALGAALFTILSVASPAGDIGRSSFDPSRIASQVVVGIGFIGGGLIIFKNDRMEGLTTAAGLWATAAIGMAVGFGFYIVAVYSTLQYKNRSNAAYELNQGLKEKTELLLGIKGYYTNL